MNDRRRAATPEADPAAGEDRAQGWLARHPGVVPLVASAGFLGLFQAVVLAWRNQGMGGWQVAFGIAWVGWIAGLLTVLLLTPVVLWLRRRHPRWRRGERRGATWAVVFALSSATAAWMVADQWAAGPLVPSWLEPWVEGTAALAAAFATSWVRVPDRWLGAGAVATAVLLALSLASLPAAGGPSGPEDPAPDHPAGEPPTRRVADAGLPDVVLVSIDTLRADRLGAYGRSPSITANFFQQPTPVNGPWY